MTQLTLEAKEAVLAKAVARGDTYLGQIASDCGVGYSTLQLWLRLKREGLPLKCRWRGRPSQEQPLAHLVATANLGEEAIGVYCREQGVHSFKLKQWRDNLMTNSSEKEGVTKRK